MKTLFQDMKRIVSGLQTSSSGTGLLAARSNVAFRRPQRTRARLALESLESRTLLTGNVPLAGPPSLTVSAGSPTSVNVSWNIPPNTYNPASYVVDMQAPDAPGIWQQIDELNYAGNSPSISVPGLSADTTYWFRVAEGTDSGDPFSYWSTPESATTLPLTMTTPAFTATSSQNQINLSWNSEAGASGYNIYDGTNTTTPYTQVDASATGYSFGSLRPGTTYYFGVGAFNPGSTSMPQMRAATTLPATPTFSLAAVSSTQINVSWGSVAGATGYEVEWSGGGSLHAVNLSSSTTGYGLTSLAAGTNYQVQVAAYDAGGSSWASRQSTITFPAAPSISLFTMSTTQIAVNWNAEAGVSNYEVEETWIGGWMGVAAVSGSTTSRVFSGLTPGTPYEFDLIATNASGSTWATSAAIAYTLPVAPTVTATPVSESQVNLSWNSVAGATGYSVQWWSSTNPTVATTVGSTATSYSVTGLSPDMTYTFKVVAFDPGGYSAQYTENALTFPAAPTFSFSGVYASQVNLSWNYVAGASAYEVAEWVNNAWQVIANIPQSNTSSPVTSLSVTGLSSGWTYYFDVGAYNASGGSWAPDQGVTTVSIPRRPLPGVPGRSQFCDRRRRRSTCELVSADRWKRHLTRRSGRAWIACTRTENTRCVAARDQSPLNNDSVGQPAAQAGFQLVACGDPKPLHLCFRQAQDHRGFRLGHAVVPDQVKNTSLTGRQALDQQVKILPEGQFLLILIGASRFNKRPPVTLRRTVDPRAFVVRSYAVRAEIMPAQVDQLAADLKRRQRKEVLHAVDRRRAHRAQEPHNGALQDVVNIDPTLQAIVLLHHFADEQPQPRARMTNQLVTRGLIAGVQPIDPCLYLSRRFDRHEKA